MPTSSPTLEMAPSSPPNQGLPVNGAKATMHFDAEPSEDVKVYVDSQEGWFALQVLGCLINSPAFYDAVRGQLCVDLKTREFATDFRDDVDNAIFRIVKDYHALVAGAAQASVSDDFARGLLQKLAMEYKIGFPMLLGPDEVGAALIRLNAARNVRLDEALPVVTSGFNYWLKKQRVFRTIRALTSVVSWHPGNLVEALQNQTSAVDTIAGDETAKSFGAGLDDGGDDVPRIPTGLRCLDVPLGGGLARGEFSLFIASTGVGKTVLATQVAAHFATMGLGGLLITTEERRKDLELRMVSNRAGIPYKRILERFDPGLLTGVDHERYHAVRAALDSRLTIVEWLGDRSRSVGQDLESEVRKAGKIDFVILDWIGGALGETKPELVRLAYQAAANKLADIARAHNLICIGLAQAHPAQSRNKAKVDSTMLCECKTMGQRATNIVGISGLEQVIEDGCESERIYQDRQFFFISKCRKSKGGLKPFIREFDYQRIRDV